MPNEPAASPPPRRVGLRSQHHVMRILWTPEHFRMNRTRPPRAEMPGNGMRYRAIYFGVPIIISFQTQLIAPINNQTRKIDATQKCQETPIRIMPFRHDFFLESRTHRAIPGAPIAARSHLQGILPRSVRASEDRIYLRHPRLFIIPALCDGNHRIPEKILLRFSVANPTVNQFANGELDE